MRTEKLYAKNGTERKNNMEKHNRKNNNYGQQGIKQIMAEIPRGISR